MNRTVAPSSTQTASTEESIHTVGFSVVIPYFRGSQFISKALASVKKSLAAVALPSEIIVVDDSPHDAQLPGLVGNGPVRLIVNESNRGIAASRNAGLAASRYEYVHFLDQDDEVAPNFYQEAYRFLGQGSEAVLFNAVIRKNDGSRVWFRPAFRLILRCWLTDKRAIKYGIITKTIGQLVFKKNIAVPFIESEFQGADDLFAYARLLRDRKDHLAYCAEPLLVYLDHGANYSYSADFEKSLALSVSRYAAEKTSIPAKRQLTSDNILPRTVAARALFWTARMCLVRRR